MTTDAEHAVPSPPSRRLPPVTELAVISVALVLSGGVYLGAHLPHQPRSPRRWGSSRVVASSRSSPWCY